jgi:hypothetical protein
MRPTLRLLAASLCLAVPALAETPEGAPPRIYRWVDENGVAHYTTSLERVPEELRDQPLRREEVSAQAPPAVDAWVLRERVPDPPAPEATAPTGEGGGAVSALDARIAELEAAIAADEQLLKGDLVGTDAPASNETLKEVAERMPGRIAELKKLQAARDALTGAGAE